MTTKNLCLFINLVVYLSYYILTVTAHTHQKKKKTKQNKTKQTHCLRASNCFKISCAISLKLMHLELSGYQHEESN